jgi:cytochrome c biogenesis protein CcdA
MKHIRKWLLVLTAIATLFTFAPRVRADEPIHVYFFYDRVCVHCQAEKLVLEEMETRYSNLSVHYLEITQVPENNALFEQVKEAFDYNGLTPYTVIGGVALAGYNEQVKKNIEKLIVRYSRTAYVDVVAKIIANEPLLESDFDTIGFSAGDTIYLPILGEVGIDSLSLGLAAVVIGIVDGFNPCAMWVLIFLITMLLQEKNRKRMWILGVTFLVASATVYFLFMVAWLNVALSVVAIGWIRILIGLLAFGFGTMNVVKFVKETRAKDVGCEVTTPTKRQKIMQKIRDIVAKKSLLPAMAGIIVLAASVNLIELACSAGLPLLFTQILAYNQLDYNVYLFYILIYILFFLIDDLIVFAIAMITFRLTGITNRYQKWSHLVGGMIMILIAILLVFFPNILSFQF